ncbi:M20/M25/M40 family metallo-hydrolase [Elioraea tepidiphila]|uniref:M20/M25/M40 family metallo-hydrolase n=1 Tax=Elioraea tepidiphila TaxID=457934 RepID=UPI00037A3A85|nr:M20/M25/M40 family metallo-hydrolase [Elioraea tepidiphila]
MDKATLAAWLARDRELIIGFLQELVRAPSPNPPGDTRAAAAVITRFLDRHGLPWRLVAPVAEWPNIVGTIETGRPGRHLVLNGHIDVFPVDESEPWTHGPWSGALADGKIWGRGVVDMKAGTAASVMTYRYLHEARAALAGRVTLTCVSDEETFGPYGARWLVANEPEVLGDCVLNGEPSSPHTIRFGEKAPLWLRFTVRTPGAHGAYTHLSESATVTAARLIGALETLGEEAVEPPGPIGEALRAGGAAMDQAMGPGAAAIASRYTVNIGTIRGGLKVNMLPGECRFEADIRLPVGGSKAHVMARLADILRRYPSATVEELNFTEPAACDPNHEMVRHLRANARAVSGIDPLPVISLGGTDARLWRQRGIPAYVYGPSPRGMGQKDEHVPVEEYLHVVAVHVLSAFDYLARTA